MKYNLNNIVQIKLEKLADEVSVQLTHTKDLRLEF